MQIIFSGPEEPRDRDSEEKISIVNSIIKNGVTLEHLRIFFGDSTSVAQLSSLVFSRAYALRVKVVSLEVDYTLDFHNMIHCGMINIESRVNEENFPIPQELVGSQQSVCSELFHFDEEIDTEEVIARMEKKNCRPATLAELVAFTTTEECLLLSNHFPIVALGSTCQSEEFGGTKSLVTVADTNEDGPILETAPSEEGWQKYHRFLGIYK